MQECIYIYCYTFVHTKQMKHTKKTLLFVFLFFSDSVCCVLLFVPCLCARMLFLNVSSLKTVEVEWKSRELTVLPQSLKALRRDKVNIG